jgi:3-oxoacyl-[acyl-carrier protein] reductase
MSSTPSILITGASGGIGRAAAIECATRGARIGVHYNGNRERAEATLAALPGEGHQLFQCDITDPEAVEALIEDAERFFDGLDVLVNNAGVSQRHRFQDIDYATWQESWHRIVTTNLTAASNLSFCAGKKIVPPRPCP